MTQIHLHEADGSTKVWSVEPLDIPKVLQGLKNLPIETLLGDPEVVPIAEKVAWRYAHMKAGAFFNVGDEILFGKYKTKRGRIVQFSLNEKGQPIVEIEPIPKGRKKNKVMGLYKIWNIAAIAKAQKKDSPMDRLATRVAGRFVVAMGIPLGETWEAGSVRIHRYRDNFQVTDLENAGKRGKRVRVMALSPSFYFKGNHEEWMDRMSVALPGYHSYDAIKGFIKDLLHDYPNEIDINEREVRGVDVNPGGTTKIRLKTNTGLEITADPLDFHVMTHVPLRHPKTGDPIGFQDTLYGPVNRRRDARVFYNWLKANLSEANRMTIEDFKKLWDELKIPYDFH